MRAVGEELWEIEQLFQVKDWEDSEDAHPLQLKKKIWEVELLLLPSFLLVGF